MPRTAIVFTPKYYEHYTGLGHPETAKRLRVIVKEVNKLDLSSTGVGCRLVKPRLATLKDLELTHAPEHIRLVKHVCETGGGLLDLGDTVASERTFEVARYAVGGALKAVDLVAKKQFRNAFALVRPPGHHAGPYYASGFCVFNNIAVAASHLIRRHHLKRILILDIDAHHGNGTQEIFYDTSRVLYMSLHEDPSDFPGTGFIDEIGKCDGLGYTVNVPFPLYTGDKPYLKAIAEVVVPVAKQYRPEFVLMSAGFDGYYGDPVARLNLSATAYIMAFRRMINVAAEFSESRFVALLEGGYDLGCLGWLALSAISEMAGFHYETMEEMNLPRSPRADKRAEKVIKEAKRMQSAFWSLEL
ncbi:MAG: histone deacetylase [Candidatus Bathyarchaeota archaeon]|nr:MAG: histone deacetylase [Candidatus Bathyarchaeota archaeon]